MILLLMQILIYMWTCFYRKVVKRGCLNDETIKTNYTF